MEHEVAVLRANIVRVTHALQWLGAEQINAEGDAGPAALDTMVEDKEEVVEDGASNGAIIFPSFTFPPVFTIRFDSATTMHSTAQHCRNCRQ